MSAIKKAELRPAFVWLHQKGKSNREIAKFFGVDKNTVNDAINRFNETGSNMNRSGSGRPRTATNVANQEAVANEIAANPSTKFNSARKLSRRLSISRTSVRRILKRDLRLFPYKMKKRQLLGPEHIKKRLKMCRAFRLR
jgi:transposase